MPSYIVKLDRKYLVWSTISDAPETYGMTLDDFREYYREKYGSDGMQRLPERLARVDAKGTSAIDDDCANDTIWLNRAGPKETKLHVDEIVEFYVRRGEEPTEEALAAFREGLPRCGPKCPSIPIDGCASWCRRCWGTDFVRESSPNESNGEP